jgi:hypothetical protein
MRHDIVITPERVLRDVLAAVADDRAFEDVLSLTLRSSGRSAEVIDGALSLVARHPQRRGADSAEYRRAESILTFARRLCSTTDC